MPLWRQDGGYDRRHGGGIFAIGCFVMIVVPLFCVFLLSVLYWIDSGGFDSFFMTVFSLLLDFFDP